MPLQFVINLFLVNEYAAVWKHFSTFTQSKLNRNFQIRNKLQGHFSSGDRNEYTAKCIKFKSCMSKNLYCGCTCLMC